MESEDSQLKLALEQLRSALRLLDAANAPALIGAHVDLAVHQLQTLCVERAIIDEAANQVDTNADPQ